MDWFHFTLGVRSEQRGCGGKNDSTWSLVIYMMKLHPAGWGGGLRAGWEAPALIRCVNVEILNAKPLRTTERAQSGGGRVRRGGDHLCAND